jgi:hypothetical protein
MLGILDVLVWSFWFLLGAYGAWFLFKAKDSVPLTLDELALAWKLHKQLTGCKKPGIRDLLVRKNGEVVGFTCDCGHKFLQKRLISQGVHPSMQRGKLVSIYDIHSLQKKKSIMRNQNLDYKNVRRV